MRILLLADPGSIHTIRWARSLCEQGIEIMIFGLGSYKKEDYPLGIGVLSEGFNQRGIVNKLKYFTVVIKVKKVIKQYKPDIVHAHYATSYGLLGRLCGFSPFIISVWGSDVFEFPTTSIVHRYLLRYNLNGADRILSTSLAMAKETQKHLTKNLIIDITPFGIDTRVFYSNRQDRSPYEIVIGTIKTLSKNYRIDLLIQSFAMVKKEHLDINLRLIIGGEGEEEENLRSQVEKNGLKDYVTFLGKVPHSEVPVHLNTFDIFVALSDSESFGVAVIEASACEIPVVVSDVGGLPEVVENNVTGIVVKKGNLEMTWKALEGLVLDRELRVKMGYQGRKRVERLYDWNVNVDQMIGIYKEIMLGHAVDTRKEI